MGARGRGGKGTPATVAVARAGVDHRLCEYDPNDLARLTGGAFAALVAA
ncbi:MAG: hypothetical protein ACRDZ7_07735 [Acidimicrobiia bacterium]